MTCSSGTGSSHASDSERRYSVYCRKSTEKSVASVCRRKAAIDSGVAKTSIHNLGPIFCEAPSLLHFSLYFFGPAYHGSLSKGPATLPQYSVSFHDIQFVQAFL